MATKSWGRITDLFCSDGRENKRKKVAERYTSTPTWKPTLLLENTGVRDHVNLINCTSWISYTDNHPQQTKKRTKEWFGPEGRNIPFHFSLML